jgi:hypothetical protein
MNESRFFAVRSMFTLESNDTWFLLHRIFLIEETYSGKMRKS